MIGSETKQRSEACTLALTSGALGCLLGMPASGIAMRWRWYGVMPRRPSSAATGGPLQRDFSNSNSNLTVALRYRVFSLTPFRPGP